MASHLEKLFTAPRPITWDALEDNIEQCDNMEELNSEIQWKKSWQQVKN